MATKSSNEMSGWVGWAVFAGVLMIIEGLFQGILGLAALLKNTIFVVGSENIFSINFTTWGWIHPGLGLLILLAGLSVLKGNMYGRVVGIFLAILSACLNLVFLPHYPVWSILLIVIDVCIVYALIVHGGDLKELQ